MVTLIKTTFSAPYDYKHIGNIKNRDKTQLLENQAKNNNKIETAVDNKIESKSYDDEKFQENPFLNNIVLIQTNLSTTINGEIDIYNRTSKKRHEKSELHDYNKNYSTCSDLSTLYNGSVDSKNFDDQDRYLDGTNNEDSLSNRAYLERCGQKNGRDNNITKTYEAENLHKLYTNEIKCKLFEIDVLNKEIESYKRTLSFKSDGEIEKKIQELEEEINSLQNKLDRLNLT